MSRCTDNKEKETVLYDDSNEVENICNNFILCFKKYFKYNNTNLGDKFEEFGSKIMINNIKYWVKLKKPICCCLPAFPTKSPNLEKVFSIYPDYGEYLALLQLYKFANSILKFYKYGCKILIIADGRVYGDLIGVNKKNIGIYYNNIIEMIKQNGFNKHINYTNLSAELDYDGEDIQNILLNRYCNTDYKTICKNVSDDKNLKMVYF